jgi:hypothetical protein
MKTAIITNVKTIFTTDKPVVVFELANGEAILRAPKLALIDLQNSGRALTLPSNCLDNGLAYLHPAQKALFISSLLECRGATTTGDISTTKPGDTYVDREGNTKTIEKGGLRVEGFLSIPLTDREVMLNKTADASALVLMAMFGFGAMPTAQSSVPVIEAPVTSDLIANEAFGNEED